jgi:hypothetical protein
MKPNKSITNFIIQPNMIIGLSTVILWFVAAYGWKQALSIANDNHYYLGEISIPSFFSTLLVLPLPYSVFHVYRYFAKRYPSANWQALVDSVIIYALVIIFFAEVLFLTFILLIGALGGGLDIMFPWKMEIMISAIYDALPIGMLVTIVPIWIRVIRRKDVNIFWIALPAILINGILFFKLVFLGRMQG